MNIHLQTNEWETRCGCLSMSTSWHVAGSGLGGGHLSGLLDNGRHPPEGIDQ